MWGALAPRRGPFCTCKKDPKTGRETAAAATQGGQTSQLPQRRSIGGAPKHSMRFSLDFKNPFLLAAHKEMIFGKFVPKGEALDSLVSLRKTKEMVSGKSFPKAKPLDVEGGSSMTIQDKWGSGRSNKTVLPPSGDRPSVFTGVLCVSRDQRLSAACGDPAGPSQAGPIT